MWVHHYHLFLFELSLLSNWFHVICNHKILLCYPIGWNCEEFYLEGLRCRTPTRTSYPRSDCRLWCVRINRCKLVASYASNFHVEHTSMQPKESGIESQCYSPPENRLHYPFVNDSNFYRTKLPDQIVNIND